MTFRAYAPRAIGHAMVELVSGDKVPVFLALLLVVRGGPAWPARAEEVTLGEAFDPPLEWNGVG